MKCCWKFCRCTETDRNKKNEILKQIKKKKKIECDGDDNNDK